MLPQAAHLKHAKALPQHAQQAMNI